MHHRIGTIVGGDPPPHARHAAGDLFPSLLGTGPADKLAAGFKAALDQTGKAKASRQEDATERRVR